LIWHRNGLRHLRYFLAAADARSFTRAAERLHVTQPTLSHQIKQPEALIGTVLFERGTKDVELTAAGQLFKPYCERVLKELETSALAISELEGLMRGTLRMAVFHSFSHRCCHRSCRNSPCAIPVCTSQRA
jgi:LysR family cyn operon transcriptional activator